MRIMYILSGTGTKGGATKSFLSMADHVAAAGNEIAVIVPDEEGVTPMLRKRGWTVVVTPYEHCSVPRISWNVKDIVGFIPRVVRKVYLNSVTRRKVLDFAREWKPDLIHDNTSVDDFGHHVAKAIGVPHVIHVREYGWKDFRLALPWIKERISAPNAYVVAITSDLASFRGQHAPEGHVRTIYNGVVKRVSDSYLYNKEPFFLYAGRIVPSKGVDELIAAYVQYAVSELDAGITPLSLKLAGSYQTDAFFTSIRKSISDYGLEEYVEWLGSIDNVEGYYSRAVATVIPSRYEGFGRVMPEAMAAGCLCVVRNSGGLAEQLKNGRTMTGHDIAFGYDTGADLVNILTMISGKYQAGIAFGEDSMFKNMIDDSRTVVASLYTSEANGKNVLDFYSEIMKESGIGRE